MKRSNYAVFATSFSAVVLFAGTASAMVVNPKRAALEAAVPDARDLREVNAPVPVIVAPTPVVVIKAHPIGGQPRSSTPRDADIVVRPPVFAERTIIGANSLITPTADYQPGRASKSAESTIGIKSRIVETQPVSEPRRHAKADNRPSGWKNKIWGLP